MSNSLAHKKLYAVWYAMHSRCYSKRNPQYADYGGRGITVSDDWHYFSNFLADMGECPTSLTLERINNNGNYCKENCKWDTRTNQQLNTRVKITNKTGIKGVYYMPIHANFQVKFMTKYLGTYYSLFEAACARKSAEAKYGYN